MLCSGDAFFSCNNFVYVTQCTRLFSLIYLITMGPNAQTKLKLNITQLTLGGLAGLAQMDRHWDQNTKVLV